MNCPNCGIQNDEDAIYCSSCGARLVVRTAFDSRRQGKENDERPGLEETLYEVLCMEGAGLLRNSKRLLGLVSDLCDLSSAEFKVFEYNCNDELLAPFVEACEKGLTDDTLDAASNSATLVLYDRAIESQRARSTIRCIRRALARTAGLSVANDEPEPKASRATSGSTHAGTADRYTHNDAQASTRRTAGQKEQDVIPPRATTQTVVRPAAQPQAPRSQAPQPIQGAQAPQKKGPSGALVFVLALILTLGIGAAALTLNQGSQTQTTQASSSIATPKKTSTSKSSNASGSSKARTYEDDTDDDDSEGTSGTSIRYGDNGNNTYDDYESDYSDPIVPSEPEYSTTGSNQQQSIPEFSSIWSGTYDGRDPNDNPITRQLIFEFTEITSSGDLTGNCYVGIADYADDQSGSSTIAGNIDWNTGEIYLYQTGWIDQGGLGPEREYRGTVDFASGTMSGYLSTKGANVFDVAWRCSATDSVDWNRG